MRLQERLDQVDLVRDYAQLVVGRILEGEAKRLSELVPDVVYMLAVPHLGVDEARRLARRPTARRHLRAVA